MPSSLTVTQQLLEKLVPDLPPEPPADDALRAAVSLASDCLEGGAPPKKKRGEQSQFLPPRSFFRVSTPAPCTVCADQSPLAHIDHACADAGGGRRPGGALARAPGPAP